MQLNSWCPCSQIRYRQQGVWSAVLRAEHTLPCLETEPAPKSEGAMRSEGKESLVFNFVIM